MTFLFPSGGGDGSGGGSDFFSPSVDVLAQERKFLAGPTLANNQSAVLDAIVVARPVNNGEEGAVAAAWRVECLADMTGSVARIVPTTDFVTLINADKATPWAGFNPLNLAPPVLRVINGALGVDVEGKDPYVMRYVMSYRKVVAGQRDWSFNALSSLVHLWTPEKISGLPVGGGIKHLFDATASNLYATQATAARRALKQLKSATSFAEFDPAALDNYGFSERSTETIAAFTGHSGLAAFGWARFDDKGGSPNPLLNFVGSSVPIFRLQEAGGVLTASGRRDAAESPSVSVTQNITNGAWLRFCMNFNYSTKTMRLRVNKGTAATASFPANASTVCTITPSLTAIGLNGSDYFDGGLGALGLCNAAISTQEEDLIFDELARYTDFAT